MGEGGDPLLAVVREKEKLHERDGWEKKKGWWLVDLTGHRWHPIGHRGRQPSAGRLQPLAHNLVASHWLELAVADWCYRLEKKTGRWWPLVDYLKRKRDDCLGAN